MNAPISISTSRASIEALFAVIYRLRDTAPLNSATVQMLRERSRQHGSDFTHSKDPQVEGDAFLAQVLRIETGLKRWFENGERPAAGLANQTAHLLRAAGKKELERAFLAVWRLHFDADTETDAPDPQIRARESTRSSPPPQATVNPLLDGATPASTDTSRQFEFQAEDDTDTAPAPAGGAHKQQAERSAPLSSDTDDVRAGFHSAIEPELFGTSATAQEPAEVSKSLEPQSLSASDQASGEEDETVEGLTVLGSALSGVRSPPAGNGSADSGEVSDYWRVPPVILMALGGVPPTNIALVPVQGDSMVPTLLDGDVAVIDTRHRRPSPDGIYALNDAFGGIVVKRLEVTSNADDKFPVVHVISDNPTYKPRHLYLDEIQVVGRVLRKFGHVS